MLLIAYDFHAKLWKAFGVFQRDHLGDSQGFAIWIEAHAALLTGPGVVSEETARPTIAPPSSDVFIVDENDTLSVFLTGP